MIREKNQNKGGGGERVSGRRNWCLSLEVKDKGDIKFDTSDLQVLIHGSEEASTHLSRL